MRYENDKEQNGETLLLYIDNHWFIHWRWWWL